MAEKFFLISQVFYPDQVSTASLFTDLCSVLAGDGIEVEVWSAHPSYTERVRQPSELIYNGIRIKYLVSTNFRKSSLSGRVLNLATFTISSILKLLFSRDKTPVWTHTTPPFLGILLSAVCKLKKRQFVYILLDILPEGMVRLKKLSYRNILVQLWHNQLVKTLKKSDRIIVLGRDMMSWVVEVAPESISKTRYIPHWQDENILSPNSFETNQFVLENNLTGKFVVQYCGNMGLWNDMAAIGRAVPVSQNNVFFLFIGDGMRKSELTDQLVPGLSNFMLLGFQPKERLNMILSACHVQIVSLGAGLEGMAVPSKIYGILACGRPVIAMVPNDSEIAMVIREEDCGIVVEPSDTDGLCNAIRKLQSDDELRNKLGTNSRKAFENKYTTKIISEKYKSMIYELKRIA